MYNTPVMGWNSWNTFGSHINEELIMEIADKIVSGSPPARSGCAS